MNAAAARQPTETELKAHARHAAFRASIAAKAAALDERKSVQPRDAAPMAVVAPAGPPLAHADLSLPPMKEPWFSIECVSVVKTLKVREIQIAVCDHYGLKVAELLAERRFRPLVRARQVAMYLCSALTFKSLPAIGRDFGGKDHTTVLHAARKIRALIDPNNRQFDPSIATAVKALRNELEALLADVGPQREVKRQ
jgi:hypothetical protein